MYQPVEARRVSPPVPRYALAAAVGWTALLACLGIWAVHHEWQITYDLLRNEAQAHFLKDQAFRFWGAEHGGVYVAETEHTPPSPYLAHIPDRDIEAPGGKPLTLMNPAYMVRQLMEDYEDLYGVKGRITSMKPLNPQNAPDNWERQALESFEHGETEAREFTEINGKPYLRLMRPMVVAQSCLKCHAHQGYKEGDVRGGVGVAVPAANAFAATRAEIGQHLLGLGLVWLLGLAGIIFGSRHARTRERERNQAEEALRESEERFSLAMEANQDGLWDWNIQTNEIYFSPAYLSMLGYDPNDPKKRHRFWLEGIHPEDQEAVREANLACIENRRHGFNVEFRVQRADGEWRWLLGRGKVAARDRSGRAIRIIGTHTDISKRKRAEADRLALERQIQHTQKLESLGVLAGGIAHDFNNILGAVLGYADLAMDDLDAEHPAVESLQEIVAGTERAAELTRQMLAYSGKGKFVIEPLDVSALMDDIAHLLRTSIPRSTALHLYLDRPLPPIMGDVAQIQQVIMNLITNAADAIGDEHGAITLSTGSLDCTEHDLAHNLARDAAHEAPLPTGNYVCIQVSDTGCGMDEDTRHRLFEPFFTTKFTGRGLGMAAVLGIVKGHKGAIVLDSEPGRGTTFRVLFPAAETAVAPPRPQPRRLPAGALRQHGTVLVIDDEEPVRELTAKMLKRQGFTVLTAHDGKEGVDVFRKHADRIVSVFVDLTMPRMSGKTCIDTLRMIREDVAIIIMSGYNEQTAHEHFPSRPPDGFIKKPFRQDTLNQKVADVLMAKQAATRGN